MKGGRGTPANSAKMHSGHVSVIAVYTPTNKDRKEEETERLYSELQEALYDMVRNKTWCWLVHN